MLAGLGRSPAAIAGSRLKPLDAGTGVLCASVTASGDWLSLGAPHPVHGFVELCAAPPFDERERGDPQATRKYRVSLADPAYPIVSFTVPHGMAHLVETLVEPGAAQIRQRHIFSGRGEGALEIRVSGRLDRPALTEITEVDPLPPTGASSRMVPGPRLEVRADALPAVAWVAVRGVDGSPMEGWVLEGASARLRLDHPERHELTLELALGIEIDPAAALAMPAMPALPLSGPKATRLHVPHDLRSDVERLASANLAYVTGCTALRVDNDERVILTDHRLLPLSWTRDAYYQALLVLAAGGRAAEELVADHLRWLWLRCERPDGAWTRSHRANGRRKDLAFQVDQQLYPLLELADYWRATGRLPTIPQRVGGWGQLVADAWSVVERVAHRDSGLLPSEENPADDPATLPYLLGSQILAWYVARRVAELSDALGIDARRLVGRSEQLRAAVDRFLKVIGPHGGQWASAVDGAGGVDLSHDANDLPTALAPLWAFCAANDPTWLATMRFAFSAQNPAFFEGVRAGLGSIHTAGPWALGDIQAWVFGSLSGDQPLAEAALRRLVEVAFDDGLLPEAYAASGPLTRIRTWFAWPGAALGALWLLDAQGLLTERLAPR